MAANQDAPPAAAQHEMNDMPPTKPPLPIEEDLMGLARLGELRSIQKLFDSGKYNANSSDEQGITALHWAAINGHFALCHFLLQSGADPNAKGGDACATPVLWASRKSNLDVVNLLLQHGADPLSTDDAGYNLLHCVTLDGNVFQLILLLHQPDVPVDAPDSQGHTALMWAAYKGFPACVDVLLKWGADVNAKDQMGFTALHWALVKGNFACIRELVEYGADRFAANNEGKTPAVTAREMNSSRQWIHALRDSGYDKVGNAKHFPVPMVEDKRKFLWRFMFLVPFGVVGAAVWVISINPVYWGLPLAAFTSVGVQWTSMQLLKLGPHNFNQIHHSPYFAGIFSATLFWVGVTYIARLLPYTYTSLPLMNLFFSVSYLACAYFYFSTMTGDPGFIPKSGSRGQSKTIIEDLISNNAFDEQNFCSTCMIRKPLRSKHCKRCGRCVAREDHHCPWVDNCVGIANHRHFLLYLIAMMIGIVVFVRIYLAYLTILPAPSTKSTCALLSPALCAEYSKAPFITVLTIWAALQLTWVSMLLVVHLTQIARAMTTYEAMRGHHVGPVTSALATGSIDPAETGAASTTTEPGPAGSAPAAAEAPAKKKQGWWTTWKRLLGLDAVVTTAMYGSRGPEMQARTRANPFYHGVVTNCADFWCDGQVEGAGPWDKVKGVVKGKRDAGMGRLGGVGVDYRTLYTVPSGGGMTYRRGGYESVPGEDV